MATTSDVVMPGGPERPAGLPDRYRLDARLGSAAGRRVYRAWDDVLCRPVVVELLEPECAEAGPPVAGLHHPGLAALYDVGPCAGGHFLVTQFVDGPSLADRSVRRDLTVPEVLAAGARLADALAYLHAHGVAHGAVTPSAVRFDRAGEVHLLGRVHRPPEEAHGTPAFDGRAAGDVAQLGRLLRRCLPRRGAPWRGRPAPVPALPDGAAALLAGAAADDPADRPTAGDLAAGLARECDRVEPPEPAAPGRRPVAHRRVAVVTVLGVAVAVLVGRPAIGPEAPLAEEPAAPAAARAQPAPGSPSAAVRDVTVSPAPPVVLPVLADAVAGAQAQATRVVRATAAGPARPPAKPAPAPPPAAPAPAAPPPVAPPPAAPPPVEQDHEDQGWEDQGQDDRGSRAGDSWDHDSRANASWEDDSWDGSREEDSWADDSWNHDSWNHDSWNHDPWDDDSGEHDSWDEARGGFRQEFRAEVRDEVRHADPDGRYGADRRS
ncbi:hypothetical protein ACL02T_33440 [Pseudonocardia sp. RS010]|uniref:hypothetical protein n=1 Tax=Pseudonocardia sp. RS010 TaxID=3385979 RepID=UPI0039A33998